MAVSAGGSPAAPVCMLALSIFLMPLLVHAQSQEGFISIDCGSAEGSDYKDNVTGVNYVSDSGFVDAGVNKNIRSAIENFGIRYQTLRSFPDGIRNCYKLNPLRAGGKYLLRAGFNYGNYDGGNSVPVFDLHIGVNLWRTIDHRSPTSLTEEIITVAPADSLNVCLVNTGQGTPFISVLELRPLKGTMYPLANPSQSLVLTGKRRDYGSEEAQTRFPADTYDRLWFKVNTTNLISKGQNPTSELGREGDMFEVAASVLRTYSEAPTISSFIYSHLVAPDARVGDRIYVVMHFAEMEPLTATGNKTRAMDIYEGNDKVGGKSLSQNYQPPFLQADALSFNGTFGEGGTYNLATYPSKSSSLPPFISALESYLVRPMNVSSTDHRDVEAMENIRSFYGVKNRNWMGDPCVPQAWMWHGVDCDYGANSTWPPRVIGLNLASSGLNVGIPPSLANLTALATLDLSNNSLAGAIPDFLADLPSLKSLNLTGNQFTGGIPSSLCKKEQHDQLQISLEGHPGGCPQATEKRKTGFVVGIAVASASALLLVLAIILWRIRTRPDSSESCAVASPDVPLRRNMFIENTGNVALTKDIHVGLKRETHCFTIPEIESITNKFVEVIGKGGFGQVYLGHFRGTKVAVKIPCLPSSVEGVVGLSRSSVEEACRQFQAEALVLTRVHHKHLVSLMGYCDDEEMLALVYEYMDGGTLRDCLSRESGTLSWRQRLKIALEAAEGLDYLHSGCKPVIIHRDVKSTNILLSGKFVTKLADFGLSRSFNVDEKQHITISQVAGTPGYLDPEYYQTYRLNESTDVYSFGVVLLEIMTGQPPFPDWPEKMHIVQCIRSRVKHGDISSIVDPKLHGDFDANSAWKMLETAIECTSLPSSGRPTMRSVVEQLRGCIEPENGVHALVTFNDAHGVARSPIDTTPFTVDSSFLPSAR